MGYFILLLILLLIVFRRQIGEWVRGYASRRFEDQVRRMMGMPTRKEEERMRKQRERGQDGGKSQNSRRRKRPGETRAPHTDVAEEMKSVAEDVEYTEIVEFESTTIHEETPEGTRIIHEEQVTDAEFVEIKERPGGR